MKYTGPVAVKVNGARDDPRAQFLVAMGHRMLGRIDVAHGRNPHASAVADTWDDDKVGSVRVVWTPYVKTCHVVVPHELPASPSNPKRKNVVDIPPLTRTYTCKNGLVLFDRQPAVILLPGEDGTIEVDSDNRPVVTPGNQNKLRTPAPTGDTLFPFYDRSESLSLASGENRVICLLEKGGLFFPLLKPHEGFRALTILEAESSPPWDGDVSAPQYVDEGPWYAAAGDRNTNAEDAEDVFTKIVPKDVVEDAQVHPIISSTMSMRSNKGFLDYPWGRIKHALPLSDGVYFTAWVGVYELTDGTNRQPATKIPTSYMYLSAPCIEVKLYPRGSASANVVRASARVMKTGGSTFIETNYLAKMVHLYDYHNVSEYATTSVDKLGYLETEGATEECHSGWGAGCDYTYEGSITYNWVKTSAPDSAYGTDYDISDSYYNVALYYDPTHEDADRLLSRYWYGSYSGHEAAYSILHGNRLYDYLGSKWALVAREITEYAFMPGVESKTEYVELPGGRRVEQHHTLTVEVEDDYSQSSSGAGTVDLYGQMYTTLAPGYGEWRWSPLNTLYVSYSAERNLNVTVTMSGTFTFPDPISGQDIVVPYEIKEQLIDVQTSSGSGITVGKGPDAGSGPGRIRLYSKPSYRDNVTYTANVDGVPCSYCSNSFAYCRPSGSSYDVITHYNPYLSGFYWSVEETPTAFLLKMYGPRPVKVDGTVGVVMASEEFVVVKGKALNGRVHRVDPGYFGVETGPGRSPMEPSYRLDAPTRGGKWASNPQPSCQGFPRPSQVQHNPITGQTVYTDTHSGVFVHVAKPSNWRVEETVYEGLHVESGEDQ